MVRADNHGPPPSPGFLCDNPAALGDVHSAGHGPPVPVGCVSCSLWLTVTRFSRRGDPRAAPDSTAEPAFPRLRATAPGSSSGAVPRCGARSPAGGPDGSRAGPRCGSGRSSHGRGRVASSAFAAFLQGLATFPVGQVMIAFGPISVLDLLSPDLSATCKWSVSHHAVALQASKGELNFPAERT